MASVINARQVGTGQIVHTNQIYANTTSFYLNIRFHAHSKQPRANPYDYEALVQWTARGPWDPVQQIVTEQGDLRFAPFHLIAISRPHTYSVPGGQVISFQVRHKFTRHTEVSTIWRPQVFPAPRNVRLPVYSR